MIRAWLYRDAVAGNEDVPTDRLAEAIEPKEALLWVDCVEATNAELDSLTMQFQISHIAAEDLHKGGQRTKLEHYRQHFHVAVHDCYLAEDKLVTREIDVVFGDGWVLSVRQASDDPGNPAPFELDPVIRRFEVEAHQRRRRRRVIPDLGIPRRHRRSLLRYRGPVRRPPR